MIDFAEVSRRFRAACAALGVDLKALSRDAQVPEDILKRLEAGETVAISTAALARVARRLNLAPMALWEPGVEEETDLSLHFRNASVPDFFSADAATAAEALRMARDIEGLEELLGRPAPLKRTAWFEAQVGANPATDGYTRARRIREILQAAGCLTAADAPLPDSVEMLVEDAFGVPVIERPLKASSVLAVTVKDRKSSLAAILLNTNNTWGNNALRRRVDLAHEVAHLLYDEPRAPIGLWIDETEDVERESKKQQGDPIEKRARAFAAEFLLPKLGLQTLLGRPELRAKTPEAAIDLVQRARFHFKTTTELTAYHLENHGYIESYLHDQVTKAAPVLSVEEVSPREGLLSRRVRDALFAGVISEMRARELLGLGVWDDFPWGHVRHTRSESGVPCTGRVARPHPQFLPISG